MGEALKKPVIEMPAPAPAPAQCGPVRRDFVLRNTSAQIVKLLSQNELVMWMHLRCKADAKSGALAFRGEPISIERIQKEVKMGTSRRKATLRGLMAKGLVLMVRQHIVRTVGKRQRFVYQRVSYWVSEYPRSDWVSCGGRTKYPPKIRGSSTGWFLNQFKKQPHKSLQTPPTVGAVVPVFLPQERQENTHAQNRQGSTNTNGDDSPKTLFLGKCEDPNGQIAATLDIIEERAEASGVRIQSVRYYEKALANFDFAGGADREELQQRLRKLGRLPGGVS